MLELLARRERAAACRPGDGPGTAPSGAFPGHRTTDSELVSSAEPRTPSRPNRGRSAPYRAQLRLALLVAWPAVVRP
uniref:Uncharacterized protein n=1 Tax=Zea mays TaxID=4577 RepID=A0A804PT17_MAIZE